MEKKNKLEYRMYGITPYNISPIQQAIQFGHGVVEYAQKHFKDADYQEWAKNHKTFIVLNGGTTNNGEDPHKHVVRDEPYIGTMQLNELELKKNKVKTASFFEPDLNDTLTAVVFLVDERVFNKVKYPDIFKKRLVLSFTESEFDFSKKEILEWEKTIGGKQNAFLREFLSKMKLA
jgi:hypothetical protein